MRVQRTVESMALMLAYYLECWSVGLKDLHLVEKMVAEKGQNWVHK